MKILSFGKQLVPFSIVHSIPGFILLSLLTVSMPVLSQIANNAPEELQDIDVVEHLGASVPADLTLIDSHGNAVLLSSLFSEHKPILLTLHYSDCPMLCSMVLSGVTNVVNQSELIPGKEYKMISVSIDPTEKPARTLATEQRYSSGLKQSEEGSWTFYTAAPEEIRKLTDALGFTYYYVEDTGQYAHPAVVFILTDDGRISRYLYGLEHNELDFRLAMLEASEGKYGNTFDRILLYCYHYDPVSKGYVPFATRLMRLGGATTATAMTFVIGGFWFREKRKNYSGKRHQAKKSTRYSDQKS